MATQPDAGNVREAVLQTDPDVGLEEAVNEEGIT
jgi:hypothetical protein